ncbi:hypothetical protein BT63DRAFT_457299 [Microthyrium microscopicum]|uniref:BTB domain-containing protein n=1 Tax=Microthyrium microscopicum TaxID=703497 RepID=A0A6A6U6Y1_9PEZI|nr:hypothetical protein BT63DRAFT_457299 [Microthyrium microscopicum]
MARNFRNQPKKRYHPCNDTEQSADPQKNSGKQKSIQRVQHRSRNSTENAPSLPGSDTKVLVGRPGFDYIPTVYIVSRDLLIADSVMFQRELLNESPFLLSLARCYPATFDLYLQYLETNEISSDDVWDEKNEKQELDHYKVQEALFHAMQFANEILSDGFHNMAIDAFIDHCEAQRRFWGGDPEEVVLTVDAEVPTLTLLVRDFLVHEGMPFWFDLGRDVPPRCAKFYGEVAAEAVKLLAEGGRPDRNEETRWEKVRPWQTNKCRYHRHQEGEGCLNSNTPKDGEA